MYTFLQTSEDVFIPLNGFKNQKRRLLSSNSLEIIPIRISTPFAVGDVFSYLMMDEKVVLVDCGHHSTHSQEILDYTFSNNGLSIADLDEIWLTHGHPDHFGMAARLADRSGARVLGHAKERANFAGNTDGELFEAFFSNQDIPENLIRQMVDQLQWLQQFQNPIEPEWISDGAALETGTHTFKAKHTPGHAPGHLVFYSDGGIIFGGDLLLEHISTNALINFDPDTQQRNLSLVQYRESLQWIRSLRGRIRPGHGKMVASIRSVADAHLNNHVERYRHVQNLLAEQPQTLFELATELFPDALQKGAIFLALSEVMGYLDWGMQEEVIVQAFGNNRKYYLADPILGQNQ